MRRFYFNFVNVLEEEAFDLKATLTSITANSNWNHNSLNHNKNLLTSTIFDKNTMFAEQDENVFIEAENWFKKYGVRVELGDLSFTLMEQYMEDRENQAPNGNLYVICD